VFFYPFNAQILVRNLNINEYRFDIYDGESFHTVLDLGDQWNIGQIRYLLERENGDLWLGGMSEEKIGLYKDGEYRTFGSEYPGNAGICIHEVADDKIWFSDRNNLFEFDGDQWSIIRTNLDQAPSIITTHDGNIWIASWSGIHRYHKGSWITNSEKEGLTEGFITEIFEDSQDRIWVGTSNRIILYNPDADREPPNTILDPQKNISQVTSKGEAQLIFSGIDKWGYTETNRLLYSYRMNGGEWSTFIEETDIKFQHLQPGMYSFEVRAMDRNCNIDPSPAFFEFEVPIPWYKGPLFIFIATLGILIIFISLGYGITRHVRLEQLVTFRTSLLKREISEREQLQKQLFQSQKMEAIGQLSGGVAHDFNNLLTSIIGNVSLAEMTAPTKVQKYLKEAIKATNRAGELVKQLLTFSRKSQIELKPVDLNQMVKETFQLARQTIDRRIDMDLQVAEKHLHILADEAQINSLIMNLLLNARDAITDTMDGERGGDTFVITVLIHIQTGEQFAIVRVSDNGIGMDKETQERIFEPFYTTKEVGKGTGLGLSSVYGIVKQHDGRIEIESVPGEGTTFRIFLPIVTEHDSKEEEAPGEIPGGTETILLVDDEEMIRDLGKNILEQWGYTVILASEGREGLNAFLQNQERIDLVILDLSMPKMSGREVLAQIHAVSPETSVAVSSGYSPAGIEREELERRGATGFLSKPYLPFEMLRSVRNLLDTSR